MIRRLTVLAAAALALAACVTEEGYRQHMDMWVGTTTDDILLKWGPPQASAPMSNGRELWSYTKTMVDERAGYWRDETREVRRTFKDKDGNEKTEVITETYPVWEPPQVYRSTCTTRFVMAAGRVEDVSFDGSGCVAEEIR
ncbi:MAG: hypothetical protein R3C46_05110 [Hyphomonadaceae bacterium]